jgi:predicted anti-sigma-YlaC factor YlaD
MKKIDCIAAEKLIITELDEGLDQSTKTSLEDHLRACPTCRKAMDETARLVHLIAADVPQEPEPEFWSYYDTSLRARLRDAKSGSWWQWWWKPAAVAACAVVVFVVVHVSTMETPMTTAQPDANVSSALAQLFEQVYGPVEDESGRYIPVETDNKTLAVLSAAYSEDEFIPWFEIEDESSHFL